MSMKIYVDEDSVAEAIANDDLNFGRIVLDLANEYADFQEFIKKIQADCCLAEAEVRNSDTDAALGFLKAVENSAIDLMKEGETT